MAKSKAHPAAAELARRRTAKVDQERLTRMLVVGGVLGVIVIAAVIIGVGYYLTKVKPLSKTVLEVGSQKYSLAHLERRMRLLRDQDPTYGDFATGDSLLALPSVTFELLKREGKLLEAASELQVTVSDEEVAAEIRDRGSLAADVEPGVYAAGLRKQIQESHLHESEYMRMIRAYVLGRKVQDYFLFFVPATEPQVRGQYIAFDDETKANQALQRLQSGDPIDQVASELGVSGSGGSALTQVEWAPRAGSGSTPNPIEDFLFSAQPNQFSDVETIGSFQYIAQLLERDDNRALDDAGRQTVSGREVNKWLNELDTKLVIRDNLSEEDAARALNDVL